VSEEDSDIDGGDGAADDDLPAIIRDAVFDRLKRAFPDFKIRRRAPVLPVQLNQVPALGVFLAEDVDTPDGDYNVGPPRFVSDATIAISIVEEAAKPEKMRRAIEARMNRVKTVLFCDPTFVALKMPGPDGVPLLEGIARVRRTFSYPQNGETYYAEGRLHITCRFRCNYPPITPHDLNEVVVTGPAAPGAGDIVTQINLPQGS
jgi:hypothetical protein